MQRAILTRLDGEDLPVTELAAPFASLLQAVSRHIQVPVRAGLVKQERSGRVRRCHLDTGPILGASVWLNRYNRYWQSHFDILAIWLDACRQLRRRRRALRESDAPRWGSRRHERLRRH